MGSLLKGLAQIESDCTLRLALSSLIKDVFVNEAVSFRQ